MPVLGCFGSQLPCPRCAQSQRLFSGFPSAQQKRRNYGAVREKMEPYKFVVLRSKIQNRVKFTDKSAKNKTFLFVSVKLLLHLHHSDESPYG